MSGQLESRHFYRLRDTIEDQVEGRVGRIVETTSLFARVRWSYGDEQDIEQFEPRYVVTIRAAP